MRQLEDVLAEVPMWRGAREVRVELLNGGLTNHTYKVVADGTPYALRLNGQQSDHMGLSAAQEAIAIGKGHELGIAPRVWHLGANGDYLVTEFVDGKLLDLGEAHSPRIIELIGRLLAKVHSIEGVDRVCSPYDIIERQVAGARALGVAMPPEVDAYLARMDAISRRWGADPECVPRYCHNDAYHINMLYDGERLTLIDWELSGMGDVYLDLAVFPYVANFSEGEERLLLEAYFGSCNAERLSHLHDMRFIGMVREVAWALLQTSIGTGAVNHSFDYLGFAHHVISRLNQGQLSL